MLDKNGTSLFSNDGPEVIGENNLDDLLKSLKGILVERIATVKGFMDVVLSGNDSIVEIFYCQDNIPRLAHCYRNVENYKRRKYGSYIN